MSSPASKKKVVILGATGSIGVNTLKVIEEFPDRFEVVGLTAYRNIELLAEQARRVRPLRIAVGDPEDAVRLSGLLNMPSVRVGSGVTELIDIASMEEADIVVSAIVGAAGLVPTIAAVRKGKEVALANKETMVMAGRLVMEDAEQYGAQVIPVDSEHSAIYQCLAGRGGGDIQRLILTASGGPFHGMSLAAMAGATPEHALRHPQWDMGQKISIDSATMMNKGLEVIEARWLFGISVDRIDILVHPQSIVHSMVEFVDGSVLAQMAVPDMRVAISYALGYPDRLCLSLPRLDLADKGPLTFFLPEEELFPCIRLAYRAIRTGGLMPTVLNAANEVAVRAFLDRRLGFLEIPKVIQKTMDQFTGKDYTSIDEVLRADLSARKAAKSMISDSQAGEGQSAS